MATLKANGGVFAYLDSPKTGNRYAVCRNGNILKKSGDGWKRWKTSSKSPNDIVAALEAAGMVRDGSMSAIGMVCRTTTDAFVHARAISDRRKRNAARIGQ